MANQTLIKVGHSSYKGANSIRMSKYTPGPWLQSWDCDPPTGSDASPKYDGFEIVDDDGWPIAFLPIHFVFPPVKSMQAKRELDWDEASSNLRLISAAPELLEALNTLVQFVADGAKGDHLEGALRTAERAIKKAEGGAA